MTHVSKRSIAIAALCVIGLAACGPDASRSPLETRQGPGTLTVVLASPRADIGGISLILRGTGIGAPVAADPDDQLFMGDSSTDTGETRLAVIGESIEGPVLRFTVPDVGRLGAYSVEIVAVVDQDNVVEEDLSAYEVRLVIGD